MCARKRLHRNGRPGQVGWGSLIGSLWVALVAASMLCSWERPGWRRQHLVWSVFFLAASQAAMLARTRARPAIVEHFSSL
jgi:hypothetical protein